MDVAGNRKLGNVNCISKNPGSCVVGQFASICQDQATSWPNVLHTHWAVIFRTSQLYSRYTRCPLSPYCQDPFSSSHLYLNSPSSLLSRREGQVVTIAPYTEVRSEFPNAATDRCPTMTTLALKGKPVCYLGLLLVRILLVPLPPLLVFLFLFLSSSSSSSFSLPPHSPLLYPPSLLPPPVRSWILFLVTFTIFQWNSFHYPSPSHLSWLIIGIPFF